MQRNGPRQLQLLGSRANPISTNFEVQRSKFKSFLTEFEDQARSKKYVKLLKRISAGRSKEFPVSVDDLYTYFLGRDVTEWVWDPRNPDKHADIVTTVLDNSIRAISLLYEAAEELRLSLKLKEPVDEMDDEESADFMEQMRNCKSLPASKRAPYEVTLVPHSQSKVHCLREIGAAQMASLIRFDGQITKVSCVRPKICVAVYCCFECGKYEFQSVESTTFTAPKDCKSRACINAKRKCTLELDHKRCRYLKRQEVKIQELPANTPAGNVPRQFTVIAEGELTRKLTAGATVRMGAVFLPTFKAGWNIGTSSTVRTVLFCQSAEIHKNEFRESKYLSTEKIAKLQNLFNDTPNLYERMANSIAPAVWGHNDVKKALLLQMVGGVSEEFENGLKVRGDIHILLLGDPGVAKSQMLQRMCHVAPRAYFTSGKGASGVGVTASVHKDLLTGEYVLEGGAIVLADGGICCVDEFDKMEEGDRTSIHEVMEQQTVSISKAGLNTTLSARTTILAAANSQYGRYDVTKSAMSNINLPPALISRFDLQFILLDRGGDRAKDQRLAEHVLRIHRLKRVAKVTVQADDGKPEEWQPFDNHEMRVLVARAQEFKPKLTEDLANEVAAYYVEMRRSERGSFGGVDADEKTYVSPRSLFGLLRMSQALARLRGSHVIRIDDFEEAVRIMKESKKALSSVYDDGAAEGAAYQGRGARRLHEIRSLLEGEWKRVIRERATGPSTAKSKSAKSQESKWVEEQDVISKLEQHSGYSAEQLREVLLVLGQYGAVQTQTAENGKRSFMFSEIAKDIS